MVYVTGHGRGEAGLTVSVGTGSENDAGPSVGVGAGVGAGPGGVGVRLGVGVGVEPALGDGDGDGVALSTTWNVWSFRVPTLPARSVARIEMVWAPTAGTVRVRTKLTSSEYAVRGEPSSW